MPWLRAALVWVLLAVLMIAHGALREQLARPRLGELRAHQLSCATGALLILGVAWLTLEWLHVARSPRLQLRVGAFWLALTVTFEFTFGHWVAGHPWSRLLADYDVSAGRLWAVVLLATLLAPRIAGTLRTRRRG